MLDEKLLSINQVTVLRQWSLPETIEGLARHGLSAISVWREKLHETGVDEAARMLDDHAMTVTGLCFAGMITSPDAAEAEKARDDVRRALDEAAAIKAGCLVFVAGGVDPRDKDLASTRARARDGVAALVPHARAAGVRIALEPLHPMICANRSVISSVGIANDWCDAIDAEDVLGIAVDTYAVWWDPHLEAEIGRAGKRICAFHINDWLADTRDLRLDRGMMGDGVIDIPAIRGMVEAAGYTGHREVEIFSERDWWRRDPDEVIGVVKERYQSAV
ncbi:MAG: sugar phosphate isomerase/epimerase [Rhodospirillaceae bacterium]|jgi:sugar phosphate isomerase/epimerase|nr:sugar phosphate isomerase/epimerase [Rhodospirillaceae bacterium]MBT5243187.1 sugar phosphate isomerase/epimerase [Rhodospirillaceae bacterium]MBT6243726.1 sugar phosphate isomerase/epimerase [Rhodospirillaceae bacterium]MBT7942833.1 sugar phosphate isomerase/epimerase [Alphaproteobacteria bacterium]